MNDLFSPSRGRRSSLQDTPPAALSQNQSDSLPRLHDRSWIGARVSPINSFEDDYDDDVATDVNVAYGGFATERTSLTRRRSSKIHDEKPKYRLFPWISCAAFACLALHDAYLSYLSYRRGVSTTYSLAWTMPWASPSIRSIARFGAFLPSRLAYGREYWRFVTSVALPSSAWELLGILCAWHMVAGRENHYHALYLSSAFVGQLWMIAWETSGASGCAAWGTCGVLCGVGAARPERRCELFSAAIGLLLLDLGTPTSSAYGAIGGCFFGWSIVGARTSTNPALRLLSIIGLVVVLAIPIGVMIWTA